MDIPIGQQLIALLRILTPLAEAVELLMLEGLDPWGEGEPQEMQCAKDHFALAMAIGRVKITFDDVVIPTVSPLMIPLVYCHINSFQRASSMKKLLPGGEKRRDGRAAHYVEL